MQLSSPVFEEGSPIPSTYTCDGDRDKNPPLSISDVPQGTQSLVLIMDDPDIPQAVKERLEIEVFDHWVLYNIPPMTREIAEGEVPGKQGLNGAGRPAYTGPCPPPEYEPKKHRYFFTLYALSGLLSFSAPPTKAEVKKQMVGQILAEAALLGTYERK